MPDVIWSPEAEADREAIFDFIVEVNPAAALRMDTLFASAAARLADFPEIGRVGMIPGTREFILHPNYRLVYELNDGEIWILALIHVARQWPPVVE